MLELMDKTLSRGVCIYIETGWKSSINPYNGESEHHKTARQRLLHLQEKYRAKLAQDVTSEVGQLIFADVKTHIKEVEGPTRVCAWCRRKMEWKQAQKADMAVQNQCGIKLSNVWHCICGKKLHLNMVGEVVYVEDVVSGATDWIKEGEKVKC
jgi:hypothetical protein